MATVVVTAEAPALNLRTESSRSSLSASAESSLSASTSTSLDTPTRTSILRTSSSSSIASSPVSGGKISFAPLPNIEPRRRKSNVALGVAARSRMLALRRQLREQGINPNLASQIPLHFPADGSPPIPIWEHDPDAELRDEPDDDLGTDPAEEAFAAIGKFVKGATRTLFRRKSSKDVKDESASPPLPLSTEVPGKTVSRSQSMDHIFSPPPADPPKDSEEGGVWEEEVGMKSWTHLRGRAQTENGGADDAYKRTSTVEVIGKKKKTTTITGKKAITRETKTDTRVEVNEGTKAETTTEITTTTQTTSTAE